MFLFYFFNLYFKNAIKKEEEGIVIFENKLK